MKIPRVFWRLEFWNWWVWGVFRTLVGFVWRLCVEDGGCCDVYDFVWVAYVFMIVLCFRLFWFCLLGHLPGWIWGSPVVFMVQMAGRRIFDPCLAFSQDSTNQCMKLWNGALCIFACLFTWTYHVLSRSHLIFGSSSTTHCLIYPLATLSHDRTSCRSSRGPLYLVACAVNSTLYETWFCLSGDFCYF